ncbi:hypothetical protein, partial [Pseudomonas sp. PA-5-4G]|uniref:hypothetical protein n=1 Tax=Pseudomonas sp. PA-5-4G TaxID=2665479 RepID=UPI001F3EAE38
VFTLPTRNRSGCMDCSVFKTTLRINVNFASPFPCLPPPAAVRLLAPAVQQGALGEYIRII